jgi:hypothetical protein
MFIYVVLQKKSRHCAGLCVILSNLVLDDAQRHSAVTSGNQLARRLANCILDGTTVVCIKMLIGIDTNAMIQTQTRDSCSWVLQTKTLSDLGFCKGFTFTEGLEKFETFAFWIKTHINYLSCKIAVAYSIPLV